MQHLSVLVSQDEAISLNELAEKLKGDESWSA
jgi:hypothetical protein